MTTFLKFLHISTIAVWSAGLIVLPYLFLQRRGLEDGADLERLHRITRYAFVYLTSPAAVIAIGSGTALIFLQNAFREWFTLKMVLVGAMVMLHVVAGLVAMSVFEPGGNFGKRRSTALTTGYLVLILGILWAVLAKPDIDSTQFATELFRPGGLQDWVRQFFDSTSTPMP